MSLKTILCYFLCLACLGFGYWSFKTPTQPQKHTYVIKDKDFAKLPEKLKHFGIEFVGHGTLSERLNIYVLSVKSKEDKLKTMEVIRPMVQKISDNRDYKGEPFPRNAFNDYEPD